MLAIGIKVHVNNGCNSVALAEKGNYDGTPMALSALLTMQYRKQGSMRQSKELGWERKQSDHVKVT
jgi:hypothetical protein